MRLRSVKSVVDYGRWATEQGFSVSEGPKPFGPIDQNAHSEGSLHYDNRALDISYLGPTEPDELKWLFKRTLRYRRLHPRWPLDELFFNGFGFIKERGVWVNYPIGNHEDHLHIGFMQRNW